MCRAGPDLVEFRHKDTGLIKSSMKLSGLHCSVEVGGILYLGTQYKQIYAINATTHEIIKVKETASSVNSLSIGDNVEVLLAA